MGKMLGAFPARTIGSNTTARGTRLIRRLGFNIIQGSMVRIENRERRRSREDVGSGNESSKEDTRSRA